MPEEFTPVVGINKARFEKTDGLTTFRVCGLGLSGALLAENGAIISKVGGQEFEWDRQQLSISDRSSYGDWIEVTGKIPDGVFDAVEANRPTTGDLTITLTIPVVPPPPPPPPPPDSESQEGQEASSQLYSLENRVQYVIPE